MLLYENLYDLPKLSKFTSHTPPLPPSHHLPHACENTEAQEMSPCPHPALILYFPYLYASLHTVITSGIYLSLFPPQISSFV